MIRYKILAYSVFIFFAKNAISQPVDTVSMAVIEDVASTYKRIGQALKVDTVVTPTDTLYNYSRFELSDTVGSAYTFTWGGDITPIQNGIPRVNYEYTLPGTYTVTLSVFENSTGKTYNLTNTVNIMDEIIVPNVFTPNNDGINDLFIVKANGLRALEISIYSRAGTLVFETKSPIIVWDGRNTSGTIVSEGPYYYILRSDDPAVQPKKGFFHIYNTLE